MKKEAYNVNSLSTEGLNLAQTGRMYDEFINAKKYNWWYEVLPDDIVVDIGANVGWFSALALDAGAEKVYMVEPNRNLLKTACYNTADYIMDCKEPSIVPINFAIGKTEKDKANVATTAKDNNEQVRMVSFNEFLYKYNIDHIDYLKIDTDGAEFSILNENTVDFIKTNVRHLAVEIHLGAFEDSPARFIHWRDTFLKEFYDMGLVRFAGDRYHQLIFDEDWIYGKRKELNRYFMLYITNY